MNLDKHGIAKIILIGVIVIGVFLVDKLNPELHSVSEDRPTQYVEYFEKIDYKDERIIGRNKTTESKCKNKHCYYFYYSDNKVAGIYYIKNNKYWNDSFLNVGAIIYEYENNIIWRSYYADTSEPTMSFIGAYKDKLTIDTPHARILSVEYYDHEGKPFENIHGVYGYKYVYDENGKKQENLRLGKDGTTIEDNQGRAKKTFVYDENGFVSEARWLDVKGNLKGETALERYVNNEKGQVLQRTFFDEQEQSVDAYFEGAFGERFEYDQYGNEIAYMYLDEAGNPVEEKTSGVAITRSVFDNNGNKIEQFYYDADNNLVLNKLIGIAQWKWQRDKYGNITSVAFFDEKGKPTTQIDTPVAEFRYKYDKNGDEIESASYDREGNLVSYGELGVAMTRYKYDISRRHLEVAYYDENKKLTAPKGDVIAKMTYTYGETEERVDYFDKEESLVNSQITGASTVRWDINEYGMTINPRYYDKEGKPVILNEKREDQE